MTRRRDARRTRAGWLPALALAALLASCAGVEYRRDTETSGSFTSYAYSFTFLSFDVPSFCLLVARNNAANADLPNMLIQKEKVVPSVGFRLDWLLDIISFRYAKVTGTWGHPPE